jgi:serralysin
LAKIKLKNGITTGIPTEGKDTLTVSLDAERNLYTVELLGGNDTVDLGSLKGQASFYTISTGPGDDTVKGGRGIFYDGAGNDTYTIRGSAFFYAGSGDDTYNGGELIDPDNGLDNDTVSFEFAPDSRSVRNSQGVTVDLQKSTRQDFGAFGKDKLIGIENLRGGEGNDRLTGDSGNNNLTGDAGNDRLYGKGGDDNLRGEEGTDKIYGGAGNDSLFGGEGSDTLRGGSGGDFISLFNILAERDVVSYTSVSDSKLYQKTYWDTIDSFDPRSGDNGDLIDLSAIDTNKSKKGDQAFDFIGSKKFGTDSAWEVRLKTITVGFSGKKSTLIQIDTDKDAKAEMEIVVLNVTGLTEDNFIL